MTLARHDRLVIAGIVTAFVLGTIARPLAWVGITILAWGIVGTFNA